MPTPRFNPVAARMLKEFIEGPTGKALLEWRNQMLKAYADFARQFNAEMERARRRRLAEEGRRLASQREDLIADGADPSDLTIPLHPRGDDD